MKWGRGRSALRKSHFAAHRGVNPHICISVSSIYVSQISALYLDKQKSGAFGFPHGPLLGPGGKGEGANTHVYMCRCIPFYMNSIHSIFQASVLINKKGFLKGGPYPPQGPFCGPKES